MEEDLCVFERICIINCLQIILQFCSHLIQVCMILFIIDLRHISNAAARYQTILTITECNEPFDLN